MSADIFDLVIIGAGPAGYVGAIRAAQLGMKVASIDKRSTLGGTCLNVGCIPSKALLQSSEYYHQASHDFAAHGIEVKPKLDLATMLGRKDAVVASLTKGIDFLYRKNKITRFEGSACLRQGLEIEITDGASQGTRLKAAKIMIATGSQSVDLPGITIDEKTIVSSTGALSFAKVPHHLVVIGGGVIGLELGSVWQRLGSQVTVVEYLPRILPGFDADIAGQYQKILTKQGFQFRLGEKVLAATKEKNQITLSLAKAGGDDKDNESLTASHVLVAVGRKPFTEGLGLEGLGVVTDKRGFITVDENYQTNVPNLYAVGDCIPGPMLAHKAEDEAVVAVERMAGMRPHIHYGAIPGVVYSFPELAMIGLTEEEAKAKGLVVKLGKFPLSANSRAKANDFTEGQVKLIAEAETDRLLGCQIISPSAGEMIHEAATIIEFGGSAEDMARICHAHPTYSEALKEAALAVDGRAIHV